MQLKQISFRRSALLSALTWSGLLALSPQAHAAHWEMSYKLDGRNNAQSHAMPPGAWNEGIYRYSGYDSTTGKVNIGSNPVTFSALAQSGGVTSGTKALATSASAEGSITVYLKWVQDTRYDSRSGTPPTPTVAPKMVVLRVTGYANSHGSAPASYATASSKFGPIAGVESTNTYRYADGRTTSAKYSIAKANAEVTPSSVIIPLKVPESGEVEYTFPLSAKGATSEMEIAPGGFSGASEALLDFRAQAGSLSIALLAVPDSTYSVVSSSPDSIELDALAKLNWKDDGVLEHPLVPFYGGSGRFSVSANTDGEDLALSNFQWTASPQTYVPQLPVLSESERTFVVPEGSTQSKHFHWDFGNADQLTTGNLLPKDTGVNVTVTPANSSWETSAKATIHWHWAFEGAGGADGSDDPTTFRFSPGSLVTMAPVRDDSLTSHQPAPKPIEQIQPGDRILLPGKSTLPRLVISKETLPDGTIILHLGTSPDDNPDDPAFSDMEQANRVHDAALEAQHTGAKYVKAGLEAYVELAKTPYYEVGGAGLGAIVGKAIDLAHIAVEASGASARASKVAGQMRTLLARGNTLAKWDKEATQLEHGAAELDSIATQGSKLAKSAGCFVAGTPVWMADGTTKTIENVKVGDLVLSRNEATGEVATKHVTHTSIRQHITTLKLTFADDSVLETTSEHPLYAEGKGFVKAGEIGIGNAIVTRAGPALRVTQVEKDVRSATVYNFTVEDFHTYFVGNAALWVHNADACNWLDLTKLDATQDQTILDVLHRVENNGPTPTWLKEGGHWGDDFEQLAQGAQLPDPGLNPKIYDLDPAAFPNIDPAKYPRGNGRVIITTTADGKKLYYVTDDHYTSFKLIDPWDFGIR